MLLSAAIIARASSARHTRFPLRYRERSQNVAVHFFGTGIGTEQYGTMRARAVPPGRCEVRKSPKAGLRGTTGILGGLNYDRETVSANKLVPRRTWPQKVGTIRLQRPDPLRPCMKQALRIERSPSIAARLSDCPDTWQLRG